MRLKELFEEQNEPHLEKLCVKYFELLNEYTQKSKEPPPKEMASKLALFDEEYSELLVFISNGGYQDIIDNKMLTDRANGAVSIQGD